MEVEEKKKNQRKKDGNNNINIQESLVGDEEDIILLFMAVINIILRDLLRLTPVILLVRWIIGVNSHQLPPS